MTPEEIAQVQAVHDLLAAKGDTIWRRSTFRPLTKDEMEEAARYDAGVLTLRTVLHHVSP